MKKFPRRFSVLLAATLCCAAASFADAAVSGSATPWVPGNGVLPTLAPIPAGQAFTFAVMGDNRGSSRGRQPQVFIDILKGIRDAHPAFAVTTGDMINGYSSTEATLRLQWKGYCDALMEARVPVFHAPGNHDINHDGGELSLRLYHELWGPTYYAFDYGGARFIALDTETVPHRIDDDQFAWLQRQLVGTRRVFLFFHEPLFPVDGHRGSSLDVFKADRDKLHKLFVLHRNAIAGVYQGHEHLYNFQSIDGVPYYISGGGGADLYAAPEQGGFHHFLLVSVSSATVLVEVRKYAADAPRPVSSRPAVAVKPGGLLESWEDPAHDAGVWEGWDESVSLERTSAPAGSAVPSPAGEASDGTHALKMSFDFDECRWPLLYGTFDPVWDLTGVGALVVDVFVPADLNGHLGVGLGIPGEGKTKYEAPVVALKAGWNTVTADLSGAWLPRAARARAGSVEWILSSDNKKLKGWVVFDRLRAERGEEK